MRSFVFVSGVSVVLALSTTTHAAFVAGQSLVNYSLAGTTQYDGWVELTTTNYPSGYGSFPGSGAWTANGGVIGSNRTTSNTVNITEPGDAVLNKVSNGTGGGPYVAGGSIYFGGFASTPNTLGGTLRFSDATPVANVKNVVFQIQIGEAFGYDFSNDVLPKLSFNGGGQNLVASSSLIIDQVQNGTFNDPTTGNDEPIYINTYRLQWDLSAYTGITGLNIDFSGVQHAQLYSARLDQSDAFAVIPAPGSAALLACGGAVALRRRRK